MGFVVVLVLCVNYVSEDVVGRENHWMGKLVPDKYKPDTAQSFLHPDSPQ